MVQVVLQQDLGIPCTLLCPNKYKRHLSLQENNITSCTYICENLYIHCVKNGGGWSNGGENYQNTTDVQYESIFVNHTLNWTIHLIFTLIFFFQWLLSVHAYIQAYTLKRINIFLKKFTEVFILKVLFGSQNLFFQKAIFSKTFMIKVP